MIPVNGTMPVSDTQDGIAETLRGRILRRLRTGSLDFGARLPSARELVAEFKVAHRPILSAYRQLADEGLVEIRERGGVYVARGSRHGPDAPALPVGWIVDTFTEGFARELSGPGLSEWLRRSIETLRLRAAVIATTDDQAGNISRELVSDFGLVAHGLAAAALAGSAAMPAFMRQADVVIATSEQQALGQQCAEQLGKPFVMIDARPDFVIGEWALLLRHPVWAIVATAEFGEMLRHFFSNVKGIENLHVLVHGRDDLAVIPEGAPTYVTQRVREALGNTTVRGRVLPTPRSISINSARRIFDFIVRANLRALQAVHEPREEDGHGRG